MEQNDYRRMLETVHRVAEAEKALKELETMTGLGEFKEAMTQVVAMRKRDILTLSRGVVPRAAGYHMLFIGNPGTGKTVMARKAAEILYKAGIVEKSHFIAASRGDLVGEHVGETALKTKKLLERAAGGVLFIDEAYALLEDNGYSFGDEAVATLVDHLDRERDKLVVILAGYPELMDQLLARNPGLGSRIPIRASFPDYSLSELIQIGEGFAKEDGFFLTAEALDALEEILLEQMGAPAFGNARTVRNLIEKAEALHADGIDLERMFDLPEQVLFGLTGGDIRAAQPMKRKAVKRIGF